jgi:hypothetical protein
MQKSSMYNTLRKSLFFTYLQNLQIRKKKYDFHNYIILQITILYFN